jgi:hypothetical protein
MGYCEKCGNELGQSASFCSSCGSAIVVGTKQPTPKFRLHRILAAVLGLVAGILFSAAIVLIVGVWDPSGAREIESWIGWLTGGIGAVWMVWKSKGWLATFDSGFWLFLRCFVAVSLARAFASHFFYHNAASVSIQRACLYGELGCAVVWFLIRPTLDSEQGRHELATTAGGSVARVLVVAFALYFHLSFPFSGWVGIAAICYYFYIRTKKSPSHAITKQTQNTNQQESDVLVLEK